MHDERLAALQDRLEDVGTARSWTDVPWGWAQVANTPLRWYKSDAYGGGVRVPLIVRWPERVPQGQIREQFHHVTDLVPTVLEVLGEEAPRTIKGLAQMPVHGKSLAYSFEDPDAPSNKGVQYFEMWGHRAIWMDGWKAVTRHFRGVEFDEDKWELFNLEEDFSELNDLSEQEPERLQKMIDRWWIEAGRYNVLPLDDRLPRLGAPSSKPGSPHEGLHYPPTTHRSRTSTIESRRCCISATGKSAWMSNEAARKRKASYSRRAAWRAVCRSTCRTIGCASTTTLGRTTRIGQSEN